MAVDIKQPRSRRALLAGLAGAAGAFAASAFSRPQPARAGVDGDVVLGAANAETTTTAITNSASHVTAVLASATLDGIGVHGFSGTGPAADVAVPAGVYGDGDYDNGTGVWGEGVVTATSSSTGVFGRGDYGVIGSGTFGVVGSGFASGVGVLGSAGQSPIPDVFGGAGVIGQSDTKTGVLGFTGLTALAPPNYCGVYGVAQAGGTVGRGVYGYAPTGVGLQGQTTSGTGVKALATSSSGTALRVQGKASFDRSGKIVVTAGHSSVAKTAIPLTTSSFVIATLQTNVAGLFIQAVVTNPAGSSFTIYLNKAPTVNVSVAWLVVN